MRLVQAAPDMVPSDYCLLWGPLPWTRDQPWRLTSNREDSAKRKRGHSGDKVPEDCPSSLLAFSLSLSRSCVLPLSPIFCFTWPLCHQPIAMAERLRGWGQSAASSHLPVQNGGHTQLLLQLPARSCPG